MTRTTLTITLALLLIGAAPIPRSVTPGPNRATEPKAKVASISAGAKFLDDVSLGWSQKRKCATCHTNVPHLFAVATLKREPTQQEKAVRTFFEQRALKWTPGKKNQPTSSQISDAVVTAVSLAMHDAGTTGKLHPTTRKALDRIWTVQMKNGAWDWLKCVWPPLEHDDYYGAVFTAVGVGLAPDGYAASDSAKQGLVRLKAYLKKTPPPSLHHKAWLLWASQKLDGLMTKDQQQKTIKELLAQQKTDGGWSLPSLGDWEGYDGRDNDLSAPSDGYATGLVVYILRQAGLKSDDPAVKKGVAWLKANQRVSGRWFTRSLNTDRYHYISHAGTAFALMALKACE